MAIEDLDNVGFPDDSESKCPCILLLDVSASMSGEPIAQLNNGLLTFQEEVQNDDLAALRVEVAIISFGGRVTVEQDFIRADKFQPQTLHARGGTPMGEAINLALDMLRQRKDIYRQNGVPYYRPWIFLITDGAPTDEWQAAAQRVKREEDNKSASFFAVGIQGADMKTLSHVAFRKPKMLNGLQFKEMFLWLSASLTKVSHSQTSEQTRLDSTDDWAHS